VIAVDGGVNLENAPLLKEAGVDWLIMGTSYFRAEDPALVAQKVGEMT
jgi:ribulose-phosphate 3-epimerase